MGSLSAATRRLSGGVCSHDVIGRKRLLPLASLVHGGSAVQRRAPPTSLGIAVSPGGYTTVVTTGLWRTEFRVSHARMGRASSPPKMTALHRSERLTVRQAPPLRASQQITCTRRFWLPIGPLSPSLAHDPRVNSHVLESYTRQLTRFVASPLLPLSPLLFPPPVV